MSNEYTPLLSGLNNTYDYREIEWSSDPHAQFCMLVGVPPSQLVGDNNPRIRVSSRAIPRKSLYGRATRQLRNQRIGYYLTASLSNALLLSQVVLGAALTALGASESSHVLITLFGAANTIIAGLVAYLKSRGQPMRSRMFLDDLERVVGEIENSEVMWLGITHGANGYDDISTEEHQVTVRSEVARLTRLYDRAVNNNSLNNPDMYMAGASEGSTAATRSKVQPGQAAALPAAPAPAPVAAPAVPAAAAAPAPAAPAPPPAVADPDESPATAPPVKTLVPTKKEGSDDHTSDSDQEDETKGKDENKVESTDKNDHNDASSSDVKAAMSTSASPQVSANLVPHPPMDPDASPASDAHLSLKHNHNDSSIDGDAGGDKGTRLVNGVA